MRTTTIAAALFATSAPVVSFTVLPKDNYLAETRDDPNCLQKVWPEPNLLNGQAISRDRKTDLSFHSPEARAEYPLLTSVIYPSVAEMEFNSLETLTFCRRWWWVSYAASSLYLIGLWMGTSHMQDKKPYNLKTTLALWNLFLAVFSFIGMMRTGPHLVMMLHTYGFEYTVCRAGRRGYACGATGFWVALFIFSKYAELLDTVFLVIRKRKVGFLHWYHHCSVLLYCWHAYVWEMPTGIYFVAMNYSVHSIMYFYYFLAAVCKKPPRWALLVTILQLLQMAVGIGITLSHMYIMVNDSVPGCDGHIPNLTAALGMYASYFILFAQFLCGRYCGRQHDLSRNGHQNGHAKKTEKKLD